MQTSVLNEWLTGRENHDYYYPIQGQMTISGRIFWAFVVWFCGLYLYRKICRKVLLDTDLWKGMFPKTNSHAVGYLLSNDNGEVSSDPRPSTSAEYERKCKRYFKGLTYPGYQLDRSQTTNKKYLKHTYIRFCVRTNQKYSSLYTCIYICSLRYICFKPWRLTFRDTTVMYYFHYLNYDYLEWTS